MRKMLSDLILDLAKCLNRKTCTFTLCVFRLRHFPRSKIESESICLKKYYIITIFLIECFGLYLTKSKNGFPIVLSNLARKGSRGFFQERKLIFVCQMACIYLLNSHGGTRSFDFDITYFYPIIVTPYP